MMSSEDDIFLKTFTQMIEILKTMNTSIDLIRKSVEVIQLSIDGLGTGLTNVNAQLDKLNNKFDDLSNKLESTPVHTPTKVTETKATATPTKKKETKAVSPGPAVSSPMPQSSSAQHPIFIDLVKKINETAKFKEVGEALIESLEQIESSFSFSRVFYEIRRIANSLIRKGDNDFPPNDRLELVEKILDWEQRLAE